MEIAAIICAGWLISVCLHEFGHAVVAYWGGDTSVKDKGYLTFNILKYTDPQVTLVFPIIILILGGLALPGAAVYIDRRRLRNRWWQSAVAAAGPYASALTAVLFAVPFLFDVNLPGSLNQALAFLVLLQVLSVVFNLLPVPGLDGFGIIEPWLPQELQKKAWAFGQYSLWIVLMAIWFVPGVNEAIWAVALFITTRFGVPVHAAVGGQNAFFEQRWWLGAALVVAVIIAARKNKEQTPEALYANARKLMAENKPEEALTSVTLALKQKPDLAEAWHLRALCLGLLNDRAQALESFDIALKLKPDFPDCWYNKACCHALNGQSDAALASLRRAVELKPTNELKEHARQDVGFKNLYDDPRFRAITAVPVSDKDARS